MELEIILNTLKWMLPIVGAIIAGVATAMVWIWNQHKNHTKRIGNLENTHTRFEDRLEMLAGEIILVKREMNEHAAQDRAYFTSLKESQDIISHQLAQLSVKIESLTSDDKAKRDAEYLAHAMAKVLKQVNGKASL